MEGTMSITFGDQAENHAGMQKIGEQASEGFSVEDLKKLSQRFGGEIIYLDEILYDALDEDTLDDEFKQEHKAAVLVIRKGVSKMFDVKAKALFEEQYNLDHDKKAKMRGRVVNKVARYNLCYGDFSQDPNYEKGKGRVVNFTDLPLLNKVRDGVKNLGKGNVVAELNYYYDIEKCYIGFHGDTERKIVVCLRLGEKMPLIFQWYHKTETVGKRKVLNLLHGDVYIMSVKATGNDWKKRNSYTLRHAAGRKFL